jgi:hypothetical protein
LVGSEGIPMGEPPMAGPVRVERENQMRINTKPNCLSDLVRINSRARVRRGDLVRINSFIRFICTYENQFPSLRINYPFLIVSHGEMCTCAREQHIGVPSHLYRTLRNSAIRAEGQRLGAPTNKETMFQIQTSIVRKISNY